MFLKKLEIVGFKSFAQKTTLDFSSGGVFSGGENIGITAIVGPNGSGKSNIADALRWVLGEQSMKSLRGKKSEDIIFAGSGTKSKLGSAQVSLYLDNSDKKIPVDFAEVVITRKIYRSGEAEYLINNSKVRLIDIAELLAKAGVGQRSYCIINQGMADQILNATPLERRMILEEAAGVKEFQLKKERSERKLKSTKINLERVKGLLLEIEPHLKLLKKQSQKAQKGEEYRIKLKEKQYEIFSFLWKNFEFSKKQAEDAKEIFGRELMVVQREVDEISQSIRKESKEKGTVQDEIAKLEQDQRRLNQEINNLERDIIIQEGKLALEKERQKSIRIVEFIPVGADFIKKRLMEIRARQDELIGRISKLEKIEEVQELKEYARAISQEVYELYEGVAKGKIEKQKPKAEIERENVVNVKKIKEIMDKIADIKVKKDEFIDENKKIREEIDSLVRKDREDRRAIIDMEDKFRRKQFEMDKLKDKFNDSKIELAKIQVREEDLVTRIKQELGLEPEVLELRDVKVHVPTWEQEIQRLKFQLEQIGGIDETIVDECEETERRYEFLEKESVDLEKAIKSLRDVSKEMDRKIREQFEETFKTIGKEFEIYFQIIFGGGKAELKRTEIKTRIISSPEGEIAVENSEENGSDDSSISEQDDDEKQTGIEIIAQPPGKKISGLGMLSGGERTLTSLALLFAIISHNPPPFAILDEVEAALDEANSKRFGKILREFSGKTQFVLITHNRQTMREAAVLYGVTMGDEGVSKLLSVKLDQVSEKGEIKNA